MPAIKGNKLTFKQRRFIDKLIETNNPTEAARQTYNIAGKYPIQVAGQIGKENLGKPLIRREIENRLESSGLQFNDVITSFKRNIKQNKELNVSQNAIDSYFKITGHLNNKDNADTGVKIGIIIEK